MKQSGILDMTGLKDLCPLLQFIDQVSIVWFLDIWYGKASEETEW